MVRILHLLFFLNIWHINAVFFDIPGEEHQPMLADFCHGEYYMKQATAGLFDATLVNKRDAVEYSVIVKTPHPEGGFEYTTDGANPPPIQVFLDEKYPSLKVTATTGVLNGDDILFEKAKISEDGKIEIDATIESDVTFAKRFAIKNARFKFRWNNTENPTDIKNWNIIISGTTDVVLTEKMKFVAEKEWGREDYTIQHYDALSASSNAPFNIITFVSNFDTSINSRSFAGEMDGVKPLDNIVWTEYFDGFGYFKGNKYQLILKSRAATDQSAQFGGGSPDMRVVITEDETGPKVGFFGLFAASDTVKNILAAVLIADNRDAPIIGRVINRDWCLILSKSEVDIKVVESLRTKYSDAFVKCYPTMFDENKDLPMQAGLAINVEVNLKGDIDKCYDELKKQGSTIEMPELSGKYEKVAIRGLAGATGMSWTYPEDCAIPIKPYLKCMSQKSSYFDLPGSLFESEKTNRMYISDIYRTDDTLSITLRVKPIDCSGELKVGNKYFEYCEKEKAANVYNFFSPLPKLKINWIDLTYDYKKETKDNKEETTHTVALTIEMEGKADKKIRNIRCEGDVPFDSFKCTLIIPSLNFGDALSNLLGTDSITQEVMKSPSLARKILKTGVKNFLLEFATGDDKKITIQCQFVIGDYEDLFMELIMIKGKGFAVGFSIQNFDFEALMQNLLSWTDLDISLPWLTRLEMKFMVSTLDGGKSKTTKSETGASTVTGTGTGVSSSRRGTLNNLNPKTIVMATKKPNKYTSRLAAHNRTNSKFKRSTDTDPATATAKANREDGNAVTFTLPSLVDYSIKAGVKGQLTYQTPQSKSNCKGDSICEFIFDWLPDIQMDIGFNYTTETSSFSAFAEIGGTKFIKITENLFFEQIGFQIGWGKRAREKFIQLKAVLKYVVEPKPLLFTGLIKASLAGTLDLQFTMAGMIQDFFGIRYFSMGDFYIGAQLSFKKSTGFSATIQVGATLQVGNIYQTDAALFKNQVLEIACYLGIDPVNWPSSWVYAKINRLTLGQIGNIIGVTMPEFIGVQGFTDGLIFSYALAVQEIEALGKKIPAGIHIVGKIRLFWFEASADVLIDLEEKLVEIKLEMSPINWLGGLISVSRLNDRTVGPYFYVKAKASEPTNAEVYIDGQITMLGMSQGVQIIINENLINMTTRGTIAGMFQTELQFMTMNSNSQTLFQTFTLRLDITTSDALNKILDFMKQTLIAVQEKAQELNRYTDAQFEKVKAAQQRAEVEIARWNGTVNEWKTKLEAKQVELENEKRANKQYDECKMNCGKVCLPLPNWNWECWKCWGHWVGCPGWDSCAKEIDNLICFAGCELEWLKNAFLEWVEETINKIKIAVANVATSLVGMVNSLNEAAKFLVSKAQEFKTFVFDAINSILTFAIKAFTFNMRKFELKAEMKAKFQFCFSFALDVTLMNTDYKWDHDEAKICLDQILYHLVKVIFGKDSVLLQFIDFDAKQDELTGRKIAVDEAEKDLGETENTTGQEVDLETSKTIVEETSKRNLLPHKQMFKFIDRTKEKYKHAYTIEDRDFLNTPHKMKPYDIKREHLVNAFNHHSPWVLSQKNIESKPDYTPKMTSDANAVKRSLVFGSSLKPCERMKRALHSYATVTNGLIQTVNSMTNVKRHTKIQRRNDINNLAELYVKTHNLGQRYTNYSPRQKRDIYYWYNNIRKGYESHDKITKRTLQHHQRSTLPVIKYQLNEMLKSGLNSSFEQYTAELHQHAMEGYKRSNIPTVNEANGEQMLHSINKDLTSIISNEGVPLTHMKKRLNDVNAAIRSMNKQTMQCQD